jgi:hypothetical protein
MKKYIKVLLPLLIIFSIKANHVVTDQWQYIPKIQIDFTKDPVSGLNLEIISENFIFDPASAGSSNMIGHGHAHLYVDSIKIARLYGNWFHIPDNSLKVGMNSIRVSLNANNHEELFYKNNPIDQEVIVYYEGVVPGQGHDHGHQH